MDQDSFRQLLTAPFPGSSSSGKTAGESNKKVILDSSKPAFQPRKVKKREYSDYRDRASERRAGINEYAEVESVLDDFEQRTANLEDREAVVEQRRYLGGDKDHTILVKGLDLALLEQNRARAAASHVDDDTLEAAFQEAQAVVPKKRTREDLIRELKEKRAAGEVPSIPIPPEVDDALEKAKKLGKFRPIGTSDSHEDNEMVKKPRFKGEGKGKGKEKEKDKDKEKTGSRERKKKRQKIANQSIEVSRKAPFPADGPPPVLPPLVPPKLETSTAEGQLTHTRSSSLEDRKFLEAEEGNVDIFADIGEYEGVDLEDEDEDDHNGTSVPPIVADVPATGTSLSDETARATNWFAQDEEVIPQPSPSSAGPATLEHQEEPHIEQVSRLAPLASSVLPSISDFLAMDAQADALKKKRAKKQKKQGEKRGQVSTEVKVDRDYKKLNTFMAKKGGGNAEI